MFALSMGMGTPLLLVGASAGKLIPRAGPWMDAVKNAFGFMMLGLAIWMMSRVLPGEVTLALWAVLIFMVGVTLGGLTTVTPEAPGVQKLGKGFGLLAIIGWLLVRETLKIVLKPMLVFVVLALLAVWAGILDGTVLEEGLTWVGDRLILAVSAVSEWAVGSYEAAPGSAPPSS